MRHAEAIAKSGSALSVALRQPLLESAATVRRLAKWLLALPPLALLGLLWSTPALGAYLCPTCYGLERVAEGVYAEADAPDFGPIITEARARVAAYYGAFERQPVLLICQSDTCHGRLGSGGARAVTYGAQFIYVSPRGLQPEILAHEFSHIALHARVGLWGLLTGAIPVWFDEGLAVLVSQDQRYLDPENKAVACDGVRASGLPVSSRDWRRLAGQHTQSLYHDAGCAAQARLADKGGLAAAMRF